MHCVRRRGSRTASRELHDLLPRCTFFFRRASKHRVLDRSAGPHGRIRQRRDGVLHRSQRHQRSSMERRGDSTDAVYTTPKPCTLIATRVQSHQPSPRQMGFAREPTVSTPQVATLTGGVCQVTRHPLHRESVEEGCGQSTPSWR